MSRAKQHKPLYMAFWIIVVPLALATVYYSLFAADRYVSSSQLVVRDANGNNMAQQVPGLSLLMGAVNPASREETLYLSEYITSADMLDVLQKKLNLGQHYANQWKDPLYWLSSTASKERLLKYYQRVVTVHYDELTGLLSVDVEALSPEFARQVQDVIIAESERFVNEISHSIAREQLRFAESELGIARKNYETHREELLTFQSENNLLNAQASAESQAAIIADLQGKLTSERANLTGLLAQLDPASAQVRQQRNRINALEKQLEVENRKLISPPGGGHLNVVAAHYRNLMLDAGIAEEAYKLSVTALENARIEANKKILALTAIVSPNLPEEALYPRRIYNLLTIAVILALLFGIVRFIVISIEDHRD